MISCIFCKLKDAHNHVFDSTHFYGVWDIDPIQNGHLLIISKQHIMNISELSEEALNELGQLTQKLISTFESMDNVLGVSAILNNGETMSENTHFHQHLIPRYSADGLYKGMDIEPVGIDLDALKAKIGMVTN